MKPVVITGANGYIGKALARRLSSSGRPLRLVSRAAVSTDVTGLKAANIEVVEADLGEESVWTRLLRETAAIVHLSARTDLRAAEMDPEGDDRLNVTPVRAMVRAAAKAKMPPTIVFASTVTVFGTQHRNPADENTPDNPCSVYDRHKVACEVILREATTAGTVCACSLRLANVYGLGENSVNSNRGILNVMMRRALAGETLTVYGDGTYLRDFIHIDDVVDAFVRAIDAGPEVRDGSRYVISTGQGTSLAQAYRSIAEAAEAATGRRVEIKHLPEPPDMHPIERRNFVGNSSLYRRRTGWRAGVSLQDGIRRFYTAATAQYAAG